MTLVRDGCAQFPDAPTERGIKHLGELAAAKEAGYDGFILFIVQREDAERCAPNPDRPEFATALREAQENGIGIFAWKCQVSPDSVRATIPVPVKI